jgi:hypothetical protein
LTGELKCMTTDARRERDRNLLRVRWITRVVAVLAAVGTAAFGALAASHSSHSSTSSGAGASGTVSPSRSNDDDDFSVVAPPSNAQPHAVSGGS